MKSSSQSQFQACEFARRAGVTVRALHHYDRLGLLKPSARTAAGYRLYGPPDFARLQQIVTLKFIGFPLRQIKKILAGADLATALWLQRKTLAEKRRQLDQAIAAIGQAERVLGRRRGPDWGTFAKIIEVIQMQTNNDWTKKYYNDEAQKLIGERQNLWSPELQKRVEEEWATLFKDIEAAAAEGVDPANPRAQALAERHTKLIEAFTGGHAAVEQGLGKLWADQANWPDAAKKRVFEPFAQRGNVHAQGNQPTMLSAQGGAFIQKALAARVAKE